MQILIADFRAVKLRNKMGIIAHVPSEQLFSNTGHSGGYFSNITYHWWNSDIMKLGTLIGLKFYVTKTIFYFNTKENSGFLLLALF